MTKRPTTADTIALSCLAVRARMLSRALSSLYEAEMTGHGIKASQLNILVAIGTLGEPRPGDLVTGLQLEKSSLSRNLTRLEQRGWVERVQDPEDARAHRLRLTDSGRELLEDLRPAWERAQERARAMLGPELADALLAMGDRLRGAFR